MYIDSLLINLIIISIVINILFSKLVSNFASSNEINPPNGADKLNFKEQIVHMLVHHSHVPLSSSVLISLIIYLSYYIVDYIDLSECITNILSYLPTYGSSCGM